jgi:ribosomal protein S12 methylthiotransferase
MKFYLISLGCAKNLVDSEKLTSSLIKEGYVITDDISEASLVIINTCGFIQDAKKESIGTIFAILDEKPEDAKVLVYGCLVQQYEKELKTLIPEVALFLRFLPPEKIKIEILKNFPPSLKMKIKQQKKILFTPPSYKYIKISDGCKNLCSYCTIPFIRGPLKSHPIEDIVKQVKNALEQGAYEINLIAQDVTAYGMDLYGKPSLEILLKSILALKKDFWLRLLYIYPTRLSPELIKIIKADPRIVRYLDIPIQHVNNRILKLMNRPYTKEFLNKKIQMLREDIPDLALRTSLIVGFPTEREEDFQELVDFIQMVKFDHLGVFVYSPEENTHAYSLKPQVQYNMKRNRRKIIMDIQKKSVKDKNSKMKGKFFSCLMEFPVDEYGSVWQGRIYSQAPEVDGVVYITGYNKNMDKVTNVRIKYYKDYDFIGECVT